MRYIDLLFKEEGIEDGYMFILMRWVRVFYNLVLALKLLHIQKQFMRNNDNFFWINYGEELYAHFGKWNYNKVFNQMQGENITFSNTFNYIC